MRLFVYEFVNAGGLGPAAPPSLRREGWAMLRAVAEDLRSCGIPMRTLLDGRQGPATEWLQFAAPRHVASRDEEPALFREQAADADFTLLIAPEFDDILLQRARWVLEVGGRLLGALPEAIALTGDKMALARRWQERRVRTPATEPAGPTPPTGLGPPWVCKPRHGAGSQATFLVADTLAWPAAFARARAEWRAGALLAQEYVPGLAASVAFLVGPGRCVPLMPATQELSADGRFQYRGGRMPLAPPLRDRAVRVAQSALAGIGGVQGYVGVDLVLGAANDGRQDHAIEINPRLTTSYIGLRRLCRDNLMQAWLDVLAGNRVELTWNEGGIEFDADGEVRG